MSAAKQFVIILLIMNGVAGAITATGAGAALDINPELGADAQVSQVNESSRSIQGAQGSIATLFAAITSVFSIFATVFKLLFYGPVMLINLGIPMEIIDMIAGPTVAFIILAALGYLLTGREL